MIYLRMLIGRKLENHGIATLAVIGAALGMPAAKATKLMTHINGARAMSRSRLRQPDWGAGAGPLSPRRLEQNRVRFGRSPRV